MIFFCNFSKRYNCWLEGKKIWNIHTDTRLSRSWTILLLGLKRIWFHFKLHKLSSLFDYWKQKSNNLPGVGAHSVSKFRLCLVLPHNLTYTRAITTIANFGWEISLLNSKPVYLVLRNFPPSFAIIFLFFRH